ncbi:MAG TPA: hypothetical protein VI977_06400 [archaeon]|nr:hypothetical protein [archaeon]
MNLNILSLHHAIESAFEKPNVLFALLLVILPVIITALFYLLTGALVDWTAFALEQIAKRYVLFFVLAALVFGIGIAFNSREIRGRLSGVVSSLSLLYVIAVAASLISLLAPLLLAPSLFNTFQNFSRAGSIEEFAASIIFLQSTAPQDINIALLTVFLIVVIILLLYQIVMLYKIISFVSRQKPWINIALLVLLAFIIGYGTMLF